MLLELYLIFIVQFQLRISQDTEHFLINPFGMLYNEITASSLVKVDMQGEVVEGGTTNFGVNGAGFMLHAAIHSFRPDLKCIIQMHTPNVVAVSSPEKEPILSLVIVFQLIPPRLAKELVCPIFRRTQY